MSLIKRRPVVKNWQISAAEVGGMHTAGKSPVQIANLTGLSIAYTADLIDLYVGHKKWPEVFTAVSFIAGKAKLRKAREADLLRRIGET